MTQSFDELWQQYKKDDTRFNIDVAKRIYEAGAQSRQAEIDELQKQLKHKESAYKNVKLQFLNKEDDYNELRKRIDDAIQEIVDESWIDEYGDNQTPTFKLMNILKGQSND